jgi:hypothetical protein
VHPGRVAPGTGETKRTRPSTPETHDVARSVAAGRPREQLGPRIINTASGPMPRRDRAPTHLSDDVAHPPWCDSRQGGSRGRRSQRSRHAHRASRPAKPAQRGAGVTGWSYSAMTAVALRSYWRGAPSLRASRAASFPPHPPRASSSHGRARRTNQAGSPAGAPRLTLTTPSSQEAHVILVASEGDISRQ